MHAHGYGLGLFQCFERQARLRRVVLDDGAKKDIGVSNDLHSPAPARVAASLMTSLICSTVSRRPFVLPFRQPAKARNEPVDRAAFNAARPPGSRSSSIFSPGWMPRCCSTSLRNVTCPRSVTVSVVMIVFPFKHSNANVHYCQGSRARGPS